MNILHLIPYFIRANKTGGPALQLSRLAGAEQSLGNYVQVVTTNGNLDEDINLEFVGDVFEMLEQGLPTVYLRRKKSIYPSTYYYASALSRWLKSNLCKFDIVVIHGTWTYFSSISARICRKLGKPYLFFVHGSFDPWAVNHNRFKKIPYWYLMEKSNFKKASGVIVLSQDEAAQVQAMGIERPVFLARNGLLYPLPQVADPDELISGQLPALGTRPYVLFMSRLHPKKGLEILLEAWEQIGSRFPEWRLIIAGPDEGGYLKKLRQLADRLDHKETIMFPGMIEGEVKAAFLQRASLFVLPSLSEGVPGAVVDALAYGLPVLITPACHLPEVVNARAGLIVDPNVQAVTKGLIHLISDSKLRQQMGRNGERLIKDEFDETKVASGLIEFFQSLLDQRMKSV